MNSEATLPEDRRLAVGYVLRFLFWSQPRFLGAIAFILSLAAGAGAPAQAGGTLIVGMTAGDIPVTTGNPDQGFEGYRFVGYNLYDSLVLWDLSKADKASEIKPGLATSWEIDPNDHKRWIVHLREGVKWHDGCQFTADDVVWNFQYRTDQKAPYFLGAAVRLQPNSCLRTSNRSARSTTTPSHSRTISSSRCSRTVSAT